MKAILTFELPEENEEYQVCVDGKNYNLALYDLDNFLRCQIKYQDFPEEQEKIYQEIRDVLHECLAKYGVEL